LTKDDRSGMAGFANEYTCKNVGEKSTRKSVFCEVREKRVVTDQSRLYLILFCILVIAFGIATATTKERLGGMCHYVRY